MFRLSLLLPSRLCQFLLTCWQQAVPLLDRLFHLVRPIWKWGWTAPLAVALVSVIFDLAKYGWPVLQHYQQLALVSLVARHPVAKGEEPSTDSGRVIF